MPIEIRKDENDGEFISRCVAEEISAGKEQDQAVAICYSYLEQQNMSKNVERLKTLKTLIKQS